MSTFSRIQMVSEVQASELILRSNFPVLPDLSVTRQELMLKAETHEYVSEGHKRFVFRDLANEFNGSAAAKDSADRLTRVPLIERV